MNSAVFIAVAAFSSFDECVSFAHKYQLYETLAEQCGKFNVPAKSLAPLYSIKPLPRPQEQNQ